jgi:hypothetical protein
MSKKPLDRTDLDGISTESLFGFIRTKSDSVRSLKERLSRAQTDLEKCVQEAAKRPEVKLVVDLIRKQDKEYQRENAETLLESMCPVCLNTREVYVQERADDIAKGIAPVKKPCPVCSDEGLARPCRTLVETDDGVREETDDELRERLKGASNESENRKDPGRSDVSQNDTPDEGLLGDRILEAMRKMGATSKDEGCCYGEVAEVLGVDPNAICVALERILGTSTSVEHFDGLWWVPGDGAPGEQLEKPILKPFLADHIKRSLQRVGAFSMDKARPVSEIAMSIDVDFEKAQKTLRAMRLMGTVNEHEEKWWVLPPLDS